jgi:hypothetical protein
MIKTTIVGVKLSQRNSNAADFQKVLTEHGCIIKTRLGLHPISEGTCAPSGVILLEVIGEDQEIANLVNEIKTISDTEVQKMEFIH